MELLHSDKIWALLALFLFVVVSQKIVQRFRKRSITYLRGPPADSWLVGNLSETISPSEVGEFDFKWVKEYGAAFRIKGLMSTDMLHLTDSKAIYHILNTAGYAYPKPQQKRASTRLIVGEGLAFAEGEQHARQRRLMNPAFSLKVIPNFFNTYIPT